MEHRPYFLIGDVLVNGVTGAASGAAVHWLVPFSWNHLLSMPASMIVGTGVGLLFGVLAMPFLGAFEVMLPAMLSGMVAGMVVGTWPLDPTGAVTTGTLAGLATIAATYGLSFWSKRYG